MSQKKSSIFIVPRNDWQGLCTYHYCENCKEVIGVAKSDEPLCPNCGTNSLPDIFTIIDSKLKTMWKFVEAMRVKEGPYGRYRDNENDIRPYRVVAADQALTLNHQMKWCGYTPPWTKEQIEVWIDTILLNMNIKSGLIEDPFEIQEKGRTEEVVFSQYCLSRGLEQVFEWAGFPDKYKLPKNFREQIDVLADMESAMAFLNDKKNPAKFLDEFTWETSPYSKGAQTVWAIRNHEERLKEKRIKDDGIIEAVHQWLDGKQNSETGYWGGENASMCNAACGVFKLLVAYSDYGWKVNHLEKMVDTTLSIATPQGDFGDNGFGCNVFDPLLVFKHARSVIPEYRAEEIFATTARCFLNFISHWSDQKCFFVPNPKIALAQMVGMHGLATPGYMAEILLGISVYP